MTQNHIGNHATHCEMIGNNCLAANGCKLICKLTYHLTPGILQSCHSDSLPAPRREPTRRRDEPPTVRCDAMFSIFIIHQSRSAGATTATTATIQPAKHGQTGSSLRETATTKTLLSSKASGRAELGFWPCIAGHLLVQWNLKSNRKLEAISFT